MWAKVGAEHIAWLDKQIAESDGDLAGRLRKPTVWAAKDELLQSTPGVGKVLSLTMLALCPELGRLNRRQSAKLIGVTPLANDSGKYKGKRRIWGGRADARSVLYMGAISAMRHNPAVRELATRLEAPLDNRHGCSEPPRRTGLAARARQRAPYRMRRAST